MFRLCVVEKLFDLVGLEAESMKPYVEYSPSLRVYRRLEIRLLGELKEYKVGLSTFLNGLLIVLGVKPDLLKRFLGRPFTVHVRGPIGDCIVAMRIAEVMGLGEEVLDRIRELEPCREVRYEGKHSLEGGEKQ